MNHSSPLEAIFFAALEKGAPERAGYLDQACAGDPSLRRRVEKMLDAQAHAGSFLEQPVPDSVVAVNKQKRAALGQPLYPTIPCFTIYSETLVSLAAFIIEHVATVIKFAPNLFNDTFPLLFQLPDVTHFLEPGHKNPALN